MIRLHEKVAQRYDSAALFHKSKTFRELCRPLAKQHWKMAAQLRSLLPAAETHRPGASKVKAALRFFFCAVDVWDGVSVEACLNSEMCLRRAYDDILDQASDQPEDFLRWAVVHQQRLREHMELLHAHDANRLSLELSHGQAPLKPV